MPGFLFGGIESRLLDWYANIDRECVQFDLLKQSNNSDDTANIAKFRAFGGSVYNTPRFSPKNFFSYIKAVRGLFEKHRDYDVVHSHSLTTGLFVLYYAKKYGVKQRILHARTSRSDGGAMKRWLNNIMKSLAPRYATRLLAVSQVAGEWGFGTKRMARGEVQILWSGVQLSQFEFDASQREQLRSKLGLGDRFVVGNVCRLTEAKNTPFIISIFRELLRREADAVLLIVGDGPLMPYIEAQIKALAITESVIMVGRQECVAQYLFAMDLLLSPSLWEGFPGTILEAQASGLPCLISDCITREIALSSGVKMMSLNAPIEMWVDAIIGFKRWQRDSKAIDKIRAQGFDSSQATVHLMEIYSDKLG